jgi:L-amino acid N-acyltransferase YncA
MTSAESGRIRYASPEDALAVHAIYAPFVRATVISFELEPPSADEMRARIAATLEMHPWLVFERAGKIAGYAYASRHRDRLAYQWAVDVSCYVDPAAQRQGIGRRLYLALFDVLRAQGFCNAYAGIALPNAGSVGLHEAVGFTPVGVYRRVGYKLGAWHDVGWWALVLGDLPAVPAAPIGLAELLARRRGILDHP